MSKIRAAVMVEPGQLEIQEFYRPKVEEDGLLLEIEKVGVCGSDKHMHMGRSKLNFPLIPGHELVGTVVEIGPNANEQMTVIGGPLQVGDRITTTPSSKGCGKCHNCVHFPHKPALCSDRIVYGFATCANSPHLLGGFAEYMYMHGRSNAFKIPEGLSSDRAMMTEPAAVATRAIERALAPGIPHIGEGYSIGKSVAVLGVGPIGLMTVAALRYTGAGEIIATDLNASRLDVARRMGATHTIDASKTTAEERLEQVRDLTDGVGPDVVIETAGAPAVFAEALSMMRRGGKLVEVGHYTDPGPVEIHPHVICNKEADILGVWAYPPIQFKAALSFLAGTDAPLEALITHRMGLEEIEQAITMTGTEGVLKIAIEP